MSSVVGNHAKRGNVGHGRRTNDSLGTMVDTPTVAQLSSMAMLGVHRPFSPAHLCPATWKKSRPWGRTCFENSGSVERRLGFESSFFRRTNVRNERVVE